MPDSYEHYISKNIQAFYRRRLFSPMIYLVLLAVLWIVFPLGAMLRPAQVSAISCLRIISVSLTII